MNLEEIKQLIDLANESGVAELEVQRGESRVRIRRPVAMEPEAVFRETTGYTASVQHGASMQHGGNPSTYATGVGNPSSGSARQEPAEDSDTIVVKSPIVGTYYEAAAPGAAPFLAVGDSVKPGQVLCIIESMKLMNEIECEHSGVVTSIIVENGQPVEYGEPLMTIRPR